MITTKEIKIKRNIELTSEGIEEELKNRGLDVLRWAITEADDEFYTVNIAIIE